MFSSQHLDKSQFPALKGKSILHLFGFQGEVTYEVAL